MGKNIKKSVKKNTNKATKVKKKVISKKKIDKPRNVKPKPKTTLKTSKKKLAKKPKPVVKKTIKVKKGKITKKKVVVTELVENKSVKPELIIDNLPQTPPIDQFKKKKGGFSPLSELKFSSLREEYIYLYEIICSSKLSDLVKDSTSIEDLRKVYQECLVDGGKGELSKKYENSSIYWSDIQEKAMVDFILEKDQIIRNRIFKKHLFKALNKLIENIIFNFKLFRKDVDVNEVQCDCLSFLMTKIEKFDTNNGARAFSYFGTIAKHYLMGENRFTHKMAKNNLDIDENIDEASERPENVFELNIEDDTHKTVNNFVFEETIKKLEDEMNKPKILLNDKKVAEAIVYIFKNHDQIGTYNKNLVYHLLKERTGLQTKEITYSLGRLKNVYKHFKIDLLKRRTK